MAQRPVRPPARLQDDVLEAAQPIDVDLALPQHDPVRPVNNPQVDNEQLSGTEFGGASFYFIWYFL
jgi:hypothetical protein